MKKSRSADEPKALPIHSMGATGRSSAGFSVMEIVIVLAIFLIASAITIINIIPAMRDAKANNGVTTVLMQMRLARQLAVDSRKVHILQFFAPDRIVMQRAEVTLGGLVLTQLSDLSLPKDIQFSAEPGIPASNNLTPDNMGDGSNAIDFDQGVGGGAGTELWFMPDGTVQDANRNLNSGIAYIARPTDLMSSRAVSIYGATGRARAWRLVKGAAGVQWIQQ
jgi:type II secretory pathway pseudopilin PulG